MSDLSVKVFQFETEGKIKKIRSFGTLDIYPGIIDDGKITDREKTASAIREVIKKAGPKKINTKKVICSVPESKVFLRTINIPKLDESEAEEAIKWEMEANIPLSIEQVYYDWQFIESGDPQKQSVLTVAVSKKIVDDLMATLAMAGLNVYGMEVESVASARSLIDEKKNEKVLIVDIGERRTSLIIVINKVPGFTSSISFSSAGIDDAIAKSLGINSREAEEAKKNQGIEKRNNSDSILVAIKPLLENLMQDLKKTINFYEDGSGENSKIDKVVLCGGGANLKGLAEYMSEKIGKQVEIGNPWINLTTETGSPIIINKENSVRYATAVGLAMRGAGYNDKT